jgi:hypothetical protein
MCRCFLLQSGINCKTDSSRWDSCPTLPGLDPVDNFMSTSYIVVRSSVFGFPANSPDNNRLNPSFHEIAYSDDNLCRTRFTPGQVDRMKAQFELYRYKQPAAPTLPTPTLPPIVSPPSGEQRLRVRGTLVGQVRLLTLVAPLLVALPRKQTAIGHLPPLDGYPSNTVATTLIAMWSPFFGNRIAIGFYSHRTTATNVYLTNAYPANAYPINV